MGTLFKATQQVLRKRHNEGQTLNDKQLAWANYGQDAGNQITRRPDPVATDPAAPPPPAEELAAPAPVEEAAPAGDAAGREVFVQTGAGVGGGVARAVDTTRARKRFSLGGGGGSGINI